MNRIVKRHEDGPTFEVLGTIGDINPIDHEGGYVLKVTQPNGNVSFEVEWIEPPPDGQEVKDSAVWTVYRCSIPEDCLREYSWMDHDHFVSTANCIGSTVVELKRKALSEDPCVRAQFVWDVASYIGWYELDSDPLRLTHEEIEERWA